MNLYFGIHLDYGALKIGENGIAEMLIIMNRKDLRGCLRSSTICLPCWSVCLIDNLPIELVALSSRKFCTARNGKRIFVRLDVAFTLISKYH